MESHLILFYAIVGFVIILLLLYWIHTFIILYHLIRFGVGTRPKQVALGLFVGSFLLFFLLILATLAVLFTPYPQL